MSRDLKDLGILFRGDMVRAILAGEKTVTRRAMTPQPAPVGPHQSRWYPGPTPITRSLAYADEAHFRRGVAADFCRYKVGRRLWVRETWASPGPQVVAYRADGRRYGICPDGDGGRLFIGHERLFEADRGFLLPPGFGNWRPSLHMPRWASRLTLRVTDVRAERLTEITAEDVALEGLVHAGLGDTPADYCRLYRGMHGLAEGEDPWLWRVAFEVVDV